MERVFVGDFGRFASPDLGAHTALNFASVRDSNELIGEVAHDRLVKINRVIIIEVDCVNETGRIATVGRALNIAFGVTVIWEKIDSIVDLGGGLVVI